MRRIGFAAGAAALALASSAQATQVLFSDFNLENAGATATNYAGFADYAVMGGTVDIVASGDAGITCAGASGSCVDLDGSTFNAGKLQSKMAYAFGAGDIVTLTFLMSGNQRVGGTDRFNAGFVFGSTINIADLTTGGGFVNTFAPGPFSASGFGPSAHASGSSFTSYLVSFRALSAGTAKVYAEVVGAGGDNIGPILDNLSLDITSPTVVPEPATWTMMLMGFGGLGAMLRRRRAAYA